jgi:hypothetical protein
MSLDHRKLCTIHCAYKIRYRVVKIGPFKQETQEEEQQRDETYEIHRLQRNSTQPQFRTKYRTTEEM